MRWPRFCEFMCHFNTTVFSCKLLWQIKSVELHFAVGEALSCVAAGNFSMMAVNSWRIRKDGAQRQAVLPGDCMEKTLDEILTRWIVHGQAIVRQVSKKNYFYLLSFV